MGLSAGQRAERVAVFTAGQAAAGKIEIQKNAFGACTDCHATTLTGRKGAPGELPPLDSLSESFQQLVNNNGGIVPPFVGPDFVQKWGSADDSGSDQRIRRPLRSAWLAHDARDAAESDRVHSSGQRGGCWHATAHGETDVPLRKVVQ